MNNLKVGFIGYGKHASANLYPSLRHLGVTLSAVATTHLESAQKASKDFNIANYYTNHLEMLEKEKLDCVLISTKPEQQLSIVKDALNCGAHVFVEKNLGFNAKEAQEIENLSKETGKFVMVGFMKRFAPVFTKLKEIINDDRFGEVVSISQIFTSRNFVQNNREYLLFAAIHFIDLLRFYLGEFVEAKSFEMDRNGSLSTSIILKSDKGTTANLYFSASPSWSSAVQEITVTGTNGYARTYGINNIRYHFNENTLPQPGWQTVEDKEITLNTSLTTGAGGLQNLYLNGFVQEIDYFLNSVQKDSIDINSSLENVKTMGLYDLIIDSFDK